MIILQDTREQKPLPFRVGGSISEIKAETLRYGDYAVAFADGSRPPVAVERKGLSDLFGTMTTGYTRWKKEVARAEKDGATLVLAVEATLTEVLGGTSYSSFEGVSMIKKLFTLQVRYDMRVVFCESRLAMVRWITEWFEAIGREHVIRMRKEQHA